MTVKLLPFDNKSEIAIVADLPLRHRRSRTTNRVLQAAVERVRDIPEIISFETYAGTAAPFNFNGLVRHYYMRSSPEMGDMQINLASEGRSHRAAATTSRSRSASAWRASALPPHGSVKVVEPPPGPPVLATLLAEIYGPDADTRRALAAQGAQGFRKRALHCRRR